MSSSRKRKIKPVNCDEAKAKTNTKTRIAKKPCPSNLITNYFNPNKTSEEEDDVKKKKLQAIKEFKEFGCNVPDVEEILENQRKLDYINKVFKSANSTVFTEKKDKTEIKDLNAEDENPVALLGCKHLNDDELATYYERLKSIIDDVFHGRVENERHTKYHKYVDKQSLWYNTSTCTFTQQQVGTIINLLRVDYDQGNIYQYSNYYFQVMIPEICLLIFMDVHKMERDEAMAYLEKRPIEGE